MEAPVILLSRLSLIALAGALAAALAACETPPPRPAFPELTWAHLAPFSLDVAEIAVTSDYAPPLAAPHVEHLFPTPPLGAAERWAGDRLRAAGGEGRASVTITDARVIETRLEGSGGLTGMFTTEQAERYDAAVEVVIEIRSDRGYLDGRVRARAERSLTVPEDLTLNEREQVWFELTEALMADLNAELEANIQEHFQRFLL
ncbi:MAG: hypothetical protein ACE5KL_03960 [Alphaproteobacteria bacterium]